MPRRLKRGDTVLLKKTGEKFTIGDINSKNRTVTIFDGFGTGFFGVKRSEFKKRRKK